MIKTNRHEIHNSFGNRNSFRILFDTDKHYMQLGYNRSFYKGFTCVHYGKTGFVGF